MLFVLMLLGVPVGLAVPILWTLQKGRLLRIALLSGVTGKEAVMNVSPATGRSERRLGAF